MVSGIDTVVKVVTRIMCEASFTNVVVHKAVLLFNEAGTALRVEFLKVDSDTMHKLLTHAMTVRYAGADDVLVPRLNDLLAMKLFALTTGGPARRGSFFFRCGTSGDCESGGCGLRTAKVVS
jgi:hypothetical protein